MINIKGNKFDIDETKSGEVERLMRFFSGFFIAAFVESIKHDKVWPEVQNALNDAGYVIVKPKD